LDEAAGAADATACPIQAASEIRQIASLRNDRVSGYDEPSPKPADMANSMTINKWFFAEFRFWQGFSGENRLKSHR
jgi:hypothetical protein